MQLSQAGESFRGYARRILATLDEAQVELQEYDAMLRGMLRVGAVQTVSTYLLPQIAASFGRSYPRVGLRLETLAAGQIEEGLSTGALDLGLSFVPTNASGLSSEMLFEEQFVLVVGPDHPLAARKRVRVVDLAEYDLCLLSRQFCTRALIEAAFAQVAVKPLVAIETTTIESCLSIASAGGPATIAPELATKNQCYITCRIERPGIYRAICLLERDHQHPLRSSLAFKESIRRLSKRRFPENQP